MKRMKSVKHRSSLGNEFCKTNYAKKDTIGGGGKHCHMVTFAKEEGIKISQLVVHRVSRHLRL